MKARFIDCVHLLAQRVLAQSYLKSVCERILKISNFLNAYEVRVYLKDLIGRLSLDEIVRAHQKGVFDNVAVLKVVVEVITKYKHRGDSRVTAILQSYEGKYTI